jgi:Domain of unknown function (DUF4157)/D-alanyl-D-alanine carboxypeptidase
MPTATKEQTQRKRGGLLCTSFAPERSPLLQRKCPCGGAPGPTGECKECRKKREAGMALRKVTHPSSLIPHPSEAPPIVHEVLRGSGQPLDGATRFFMESRFGHDFGAVRVHTDAKAAESAWAVKALAYTVGRDVVFGAGQYAPQTGVGRKLLAHELAHVVQQRSDSSPDAAGDESRPLTVSSSQGALEVEAHRMAKSYNWREPSVGGLSHRILQRQEPPGPAAEAAAAPAVCPAIAIAPYGPPDGPPVGNDGLSAATVTAMNCLQTAVTAAGGTMSVVTRYRSQAYQDHLIEVYDKVTGPSPAGPECEAVRQNYATERATHFPMGPPARGVSNHTNGTAFDATVTLPAGTSIDTLQAGCKLTRPVAGEPWHFET